MAAGNLPAELTRRLEEFRTENRVWSKGSLSVALVLTRRAVADGLPIDLSSLRTSGRGQVAGLGQDAVQRILKDHGIMRVLAKEGGRTSRGSLRLADAYITLLNELHADGTLGIGAEQERECLRGVEAWWAERVRGFFNAQRLRIDADFSRSLTHIISVILREAEERQASIPGATVAGAVLQHLVGAKLALMLGDDAVEHHSYSTADSSTGRSGDFVIRDGVVHVTVSPTEHLVERCRENLESGLRPIIVTIDARVSVAEEMARARGLGGRIEVFSVERFLSANLHERANFGLQDLREQVQALIRKYNEIVEKVETDQSLQIEGF